MTVVKVSVKWSGKKFDEISLDLSKPASEFKKHLQQLTLVEPDKQKIMIKGGILKDDSDLSALEIKEGHCFLMMGTPSSQILKEPPKKTKFIEDMTEGQKNSALMIPSGLSNLGNTCYMNSTIQCLFSIPELHSALSSMNATFSGDSELNLTVALRELFRELKHGGKSEVTPLVTLQALRAQFSQFSQQSRGVFMQQDAEECFSALVNVLDLKLKSGQESFVQKYMTGEFEKVLKCEESEQESKSKSTEKFTKLSCHISANVNYLMQGLIEAMNETLEKQSPTLNRSAKYSLSSRISKLPKYLCISFVRFFWKQEIQKKAKILRSVKFPFELDLNSICTEELQAKMEPFRNLYIKQNQAKDDARKERKTKAALNATQEETKPITAKELGVALKESLKGSVDDSILDDPTVNLHGYYDLNAVLTHVGRSADSGHYMAWVKGNPETDQWWKFDDEKVSLVKSEDIEKLNGGGDWHMAYLLIYKSKDLE